MREGRDWRSYLAPLEWPFRAAIVLLGHVALAGLTIASVWGLERFAHFLYGEKLPLIYGLFPLEWLFQTLDLGIILVFIFRGILAADRELRKQ
jgi:hypothetical protein